MSWSWQQIQCIPTPIIWCKTAAPQSVILGEGGEAILGEGGEELLSEEQPE